MQAEMFSNHSFKSYWIYVLVTYAPIVVLALKECSKVNVCKCSTDEGVIDLWSLAGTGSNIPRFKDIPDKFGPAGAKINWNPCNKWSQPGTGLENNCQDIAVCFIIEPKAAYLDVGQQETADYSFNETSGTCVLILRGKAFPTGDPKSSSTHIFLQCDPNEVGRVESLDMSGPVGDEFKVFMRLHTKYACLKSGLSVGTILIIVLISLLVVYLVAGILFNKYSKGANGMELIPNVNFWIDFPLLVKDGAVFSFQCCKRVCSRKQSSYESI